MFCLGHGFLRNADLYTSALPARERLQVRLALLRSQRLALLLHASPPYPHLHSITFRPAWCVDHICATGRAATRCSEDSRDSHSRHHRRLLATIAQGVAIYSPAASRHAPLRFRVARRPGASHSSSLILVIPRFTHFAPQSHLAPPTRAPASALLYRLQRASADRRDATPPTA